MRTTIFSKILDKIGTIEIGRKSGGWIGLGILAIGCIIAVFHWVGTLDCEREIENRKVNTFEKIGAPNRRNHAGSLSIPSAV